MPEVPEGTPLRRLRPQDSPLPLALDWTLIEAAKDAIDHRKPVTGEFAIRNVNRCVGGILSSAVTEVHGADGLAPETIRFTLRGSAGQSFGGWLAPGVELTLIGDANDYTGKGLSGGVLAVRPPDDAAYVAEENVIIGNTVLYGATAGRAFFRGLAGERFAVRNSGASAVVEGVGDHGCEYMTGGRAVILGPTGRNFAAGMSGGVAYVLDEDGTFGERCNMELVGFDELDDDDAAELHELIEEHHLRTLSPVAARILRDWDAALPQLREGHAARLQARAARARRGRGGRSGPPAGGGLAMGEVGAFLRIERVENPERDPRERTADFREFIITPPVEQLQEQGARCMECGVPFCHNGCPLGNLIPDWNDLVYRDRWRAAIDQLHATNNFPEFTGKLCPAPCEAACVLEIREGDAVSIKQIEVSIINRAFDEGWVVPRPPDFETGRTVAVVGAGPSGLAAAQQLRRRGHAVTVYERDEAGGGLVRFGVPDFKIEKWVVERRLDQLAAEGVRFEYGVDVGVDVGADELRERHDAVVIATGSRVPRDLPVPGRELDGVHFAMEYLYGRNRWVASNGDGVSPITAAGKHVIVIGGGDTGADCVGNSHREGAASVTQIELLGEPPAKRPDDLTPWPRWPVKLRTSYALKEGGEPRLRHLDDEADGLERPRRGDPLGRELRHAAVRRDPGHGVHAPGRPRAAGDGLPAPRAGSCSTSSASRRTSAATRRPAPTRPRPRACSPPATRAAASR